jgi:hypothetical protein
MKRPFLLAGIIGLGVVLCSVVLILVFPGKAGKLPDGFFTPIIAFEFMQTPQEVIDLFGPPETIQHEYLVKAMDLGNRIDFLYMILYSAFLFAFCMKVAALRGKGIYKLGGILALVILAGDLLENLQLLGITSLLGTGDFTRELFLLRVFTWQKWGGIVLVFILLLPHFIRDGRLSRAIGAFSVLSAVLAPAAFLHRGVLNEIFSLSVMVVFLLMISYSFLYRRLQ